MQKFVALIDPFLEKYRVKTLPEKRAPSSFDEFGHEKAMSSFDKQNSNAHGLSITPAPKTLPEFIALIKRTPKTVLSSKDRARIAAVMSFDSKTVADLMEPRKNMLFIHANDFLGPLMLDKLYKTGFTHFPVVDEKEKVVGAVSTAALNSLEITTGRRAKEYMSKDIYYLRSTDSLESALTEFDRRSSSYFLVRDSGNNLVGFLTLEMLLRFLLGD